MKKTELRPHWYQLGDNGELTDLELVDSMNIYFGRVISALDVLSATDSDQLPEESLNRFALMLEDMTFEAKALLGRWWEENEGNGARRDHTPSERAQP